MQLRKVKGKRTTASWEVCSASSLRCLQRTCLSTDSLCLWKYGYGLVNCKGKKSVMSIGKSNTKFRIKTSKKIDVCFYLLLQENTSKKIKLPNDFLFTSLHKVSIDDSYIHDSCHVWASYNIFYRHFIHKTSPLSTSHRAHFFGYWDIYFSWLLIRVLEN